MSDLMSASAQGKTPEWHPPSAKLVPKPVRRREKIQLSCILCRQKKLKCDRNQPCRSCSGRGLASSCTYVLPSTHAQRNMPNSASGISTKINQLEQLVVSLMKTLDTTKQAEQQRAASVETTSSGNTGPIESQEPVSSPISNADDESNLEETFGRIALENSETKFVNSVHWTAILDGIAELKDHFDDDESQAQCAFTDTNVTGPDGPELLYGAMNHISREEILAVIPPRTVVDRLISRYFNAMDIAPAIIHSSTFLKEYERFWESPSTAPVMWLGILFGMMCLAIQFQHLSSKDLGSMCQSPAWPQDPQYVMNIYREKLVQCLVLGKYTKSVPYSVEALLLYFTIEHFRSKDMQTGTWVLMGAISRIAMRMGYHRDATNFPRISPFHGEMRRRAWTMITQLDITTSKAVGLPRMIRDGDADTTEARNLFDEDLDKNMVELPPSRPETVTTPILYLNIKGRLLSALSQIGDQSSFAKTVSYAEVMRLDKLLRDTQAGIPTVLQMRPLSNSINVSTDVIMQRMYLAIIGHSAYCTLHRKYLIPARTDSRYKYSRQACIDSAIELLNYQLLLHEETKPGGHLCEDRWKISAILNHDFLLASTILCLDLDYGIETKNTESNEDQITSESVKIALLGSYNIWLTKCDESLEAQKACEAIRIIMGKSKRDNTTLPEEVSGSIEEVLPEGSFSAQMGTYTFFAQFHWHRLTVNTAPAPASFPPLPQANYPHDFATFPAIYNEAPAYTAPLGENFNDPTNNLIWENWDTQFQGQEDIDNLLNADYGLGVFDDTSLWKDVKM